MPIQSQGLPQADNLPKVDPDEVIKGVEDHPSRHHKELAHRSVNQTTPYSTRYSSSEEISKFRIPQNGVEADAVHAMLKDELDLDGRPNLNLARSEPRPSHPTAANAAQLRGNLHGKRSGQTDYGEYLQEHVGRR